MENQNRIATQVMVASALKDDFAVAATARRTGKKSGATGWRLRKGAPTRNVRGRPLRRESGGANEADPAQSLRRADMAFQRAMRCAVEQGREHPPLIGVFKDARPLRPPRLFEPVPHASGCTSPALECADLEAFLDLVTTDAPLIKPSDHSETT